MADLQGCIEQLPETLLACLVGMARMARPEKWALKSYLHTALSAQEAETMLHAIEAIPEAPLFEDVSRFTLPGWEEGHVGMTWELAAQARSQKNKLTNEQ